MRFGKIVVIMMITFGLMVACSGENTAEQMYEHLERAVTLEEPFAKQQQPLVELEQQEKELYDQIINLGLAEFDQVKTLSEEALSLIEERSGIVEKEKQSIDAAKEEFDKIEPLIKEIEDPELKEKAQELNDTMQQRYDAYLQLNNSYANSLEQDKKLYQMLQKEDVKEEQLKTQIEEVNSSYDKVIAANSTFNQKTEAYNELKQQFYQEAGLEIEHN